MSRHFRDTVTPTLFVRRLPVETPLPGEGDVLAVEHHANPVAIPCGRVAIVWNLVTLGLKGDDEPVPFQFHPTEGVVFEPPPESKLAVLPGRLGRISDTQWAILVQNDRTTKDGCFVVDYTFRLKDPDGKVYGPPIDPSVLVTPDPTIPPG